MAHERTHVPRDVHHGIQLANQVAALLPTHRSNATRSSRKAMTENRQWSAPSLEQAVEIAQGILPREFESWDEVPGRSRDMLLPTPAAQEPGGTAEAHLERKNKLDGANRVTPTHLAYIEHLLPTPGANDHTGGEGPTREARQQEGKTGGPQLRDIGHLLPTPMANPDNPGAGGELRAAIQHGPGRRNETGVDSWGRPNHGRRLLPTPRTTDQRGPGEHGEGGPDLRTAVTLLPTPTTQDGENTGGPSQHQRNSLPLNAAVQHLTDGRLLPTPLPNRGRNATASRSEDSKHNDGETLQDAIWKVEGRTETITGKPLAAAPSTGAPTPPPSSGGSSSSDEPPPAQLTIADA